MRRYAMDELIKWKNSDYRKPMLIMGARQVGKTWLMKEFGRTQYSQVAYVSFYNNPRMTSVFQSGFDIKQIISSLNIETGLDITPEDTLIIFDEIQNSLSVLESLKYFQEDAPEYHIIAAGSLLGVALHEGVSYPVGKVNLLDLYPMNYREFLEAMGECQLAKALSSADYDIINAFKDKYEYWLKNYLYTGGMPGVVDYFREHKNYTVVRKMQNDIIKQYKGDFGKHIRAGELPKIHMVWDAIPSQLGKENKKFFFGNIKKGGRSKEFENSIQWLTDSGLVYKVNKVSEPHMPLAAYRDFSSFKLFVLDVGLLGALSGLDPESILEGSNIFIEFKGALTEQYVFQQIISDTEYTPFYYISKNGTYEQDFLIQKGKTIVPIEVKSGCSVNSPSLKSFIEKYNPDCAVRFSLLPYKQQEKITNIPLCSVCNL